MKLEMIKNQTLNLINNGQVKEALAILSTHAIEVKNSSLKRDADLLKARFTDISRKKTLGLLSNSNVKLKLNELSESIVFLMDEMKVDETSTDNVD